MIHAGVELDGSERREAGLKTGHVIQRETEQCEPIDEPIIGNFAECQKLVKAWTELTPVNSVVEVVGNVMERAKRRTRPGHSCNLGEGQSALGKQRADFLDKTGSGLGLGGAHGPASAKGNREFPAKNISVAVIPD